MRCSSHRKKPHQKWPFSLIMQQLKLCSLEWDDAFGLESQAIKLMNLGAPWICPFKVTEMRGKKPVKFKA